MLPIIPPSLDARLQPHLQRVRDETHTDDDILPAVFGLILKQQYEMALELRNAVASAADEASDAARASKQQLELVHGQQHDMTLGVTNAVSNLAAEANVAAQASRQEFELVHTQQQEQQKLAVSNTVKLNSALKGIAEYHAALDARLKAMESEMTKRASIALTVQVLSLVVLIGSIVFLLLKR